MGSQTQQAKFNPESIPPGFMPTSSIIQENSAAPFRFDDENTLDEGLTPILENVGVVCKQDKWVLAQASSSLAKVGNRKELSFRVKCLSGDQEGRMMVYIGICTKRRKSAATGSRENPFLQGNSFGIVLQDGGICVNGACIQYTQQPFAPGDVLDMCINLQSGQLWYKINGISQEIACQDELLTLDGKELFPTAFIYGAGTSISFLNPTKKEMQINNAVREYETNFSKLIREIDMAHQMKNEEVARTKELDGKIRSMQTDLDDYDMDICSLEDNLQKMTQEKIEIQTELQSSESKFNSIANKCKDLESKLKESQEQLSVFEDRLKVSELQNTQLKNQKDQMPAKLKKHHSSLPISSKSSSLLEMGKAIKVSSQASEIILKSIILLSSSSIDPLAELNRLQDLIINFNQNQKFENKVSLATKLDQMGQALSSMQLGAEADKPIESMDLSLLVKQYISQHNSKSQKKGINKMNTGKFNKQFRHQTKI